jgi:hypothetical protein
MAGNKHDNGVHEQGTDETRMAYQEDTPGQSVQQYIEDRNKAYHEEAVEKKKKHFSQVFQNPLKGFPYNEEIEVKEIKEGAYADRLRDKTKSQQKAHQKSMIKIARKSIKDYEKRNKKEEIEENADASLKKKSEKSGISVGILKQVYNRGVAAWKTGHRPGTTPEQWGHARVNSFITKGSGTWGKADKDLAKQVG